MPSWKQPNKIEKALKKERQEIMEYVVETLKKVRDNKQKQEPEDVCAEISNWIMKRIYGVKDEEKSSNNWYRWYNG